MDLAKRLDQPVVLVGLMGVGKSTVGRRLAKRLGLPFVDSDSAIEDAAGYTAAEVFERYGEQDFRDGERRLVARLIDGEIRVIATGDLHAGLERSFSADRALPEEEVRNPA